MTQNLNGAPLMENDVFTRSARLILLTTTLALGASCASITPAPDGAHLSPRARECTEGAANATSCMDALFEAAAQGKRREAGQLLLTLSSQSGNDEERDALISAGLWLEPEPWLPEGSNLLEGDLAPLATRTGEVEAGEVLVFKGARLRAKKKRKVRFTIDYAPTLLQPEALAALMAAASGADAAAFEHSGDGETRVVSASARAVAVTGYAPAFSGDQLELARAFTGADRAWNGGRHLDATGVMNDLLDKLGDDGEFEQASAALCASAGVIAASAATVAALSHGDPGTKRGKVRDACVGERETLDSRASFLGAMSELEVSISNLEEFERVWKPRIDAASGKWTTRQTQLAEVLRERQYARSARASASCNEEATAKLDGDISAFDAKLRALSREDLALATEAAAVLYPEGAEYVSSKGLKTWLKDQRLEDRQWLGIEALGAAIDGIEQTSTPLERVTFATACDLYQRELEGLLRAEKSATSPWRTSERMVAGVMRMRYCPSHTKRTRSIVAAAVQGSSAHPDGSAAIAQLIAATTLTGIARMLGGEMNAVMEIATAMISELKRVRMSLGDSPDDRTLAALLDALAGSAEKLADPSAVNKQVISSVDALDAIISESAGASSKMTRAAPVIRLSLLAFASAHGALFGIPDRSLQAIERLEKNLETDLAAFLAMNDQPATMAKPMSKHVLAATTLVRGALLGQNVDIDGALAGANAKDFQAGWWRAGANISASLLRLATAIIYHQANATAEVAKHRAALNAQLDALAKDAVADFELQGSGWELLTLLAPAQTAIGDAILDGSDDAWEKILAQALPTLEKRAQEVLSSAKALDSSGAPPDLVSLMLELVRATLSVGIENMYKDGAITDESRLALAKELSTNADAFPAQMRVILESIRAVLLAKPDPSSSLAALGKAQKLASTGSRELEPLPLAVGLFLDREGQRSPKKTLELITELGLDQSESTDCERRALARALLPYRAKLLSLDQDRDRASGLRRAYLRGVLAGEHMDARIQLLASAQRGHLAANVDISYPASRLLSSRRTFPEDEAQQGNFQIGLGYSSLTVFKQTLQCNVNALPQERAEFVASVAFELAVDSLLYASLEVAQSDLQLATATLMALNARANSPNQLIDDVSAFPWITHLAGGRGLMLEARRFELITLGYPVHQLDGEAFGRFEARYPSIAPVIRAADAVDARALDKAWPSDAPKTLSKDMMLATAYYRANKREEARKLLAAITPAPVQLNFVDAVAEVEPTQFKKVSDALRSVKLDAEACELGLELMKTTPRPQATTDLIYGMWRTLDPELVSSCHGNLAIELLGKSTDASERVELRGALLDLEYFPQKEPLMMQQARDLLELGKLEKVMPLLHDFASRVLRVNSSALVYLATMELTGEIASGNAPDPLVMVNLQEIAKESQGIPPELMKWIDRMHAQREDPGAITGEAQQLLFSFLR
jgi:hypothetical protein